MLIVIMCFVWVSGQAEKFALHNIKSLVIITEVESVKARYGLSAYIYI